MRWASRPHHLDSLLGVCDGKLEVVEASSLHSSEKVELISNIRQRLGIHVHLLVRDGKTRHIISPLLEKLGNHGKQGAVGNQTDDNTERNRDEAKDNSNTPKGAGLSLLCNLECVATDKDDENLTTTHNGTNADKEPILGKSFKDVEPVIQATVAIDVRWLLYKEIGNTYFHWLKICIHTNVLNTSVAISSLLGMFFVGKTPLGPP